MHRESRKREEGGAGDACDAAVASAAVLEDDRFLDLDLGGVGVEVGGVALDDDDARCLDGEAALLFFFVVVVVGTVAGGTALILLLLLLRGAVLRPRDIGGGVAAAGADAVTAEAAGAAVPAATLGRPRLRVCAVLGAAVAAIEVGVGGAALGAVTATGAAAVLVVAVVVEGATPRCFCSCCDSGRCGVEGAMTAQVVATATPVVVLAAAPGNSTLCIILTLESAAALDCAAGTDEPRRGLF